MVGCEFESCIWMGRRTPCNHGVSCYLHHWNTFYTPNHTQKNTPARLHEFYRKNVQGKGGGMSIWGKYQVSTNYLLKWEWCRNVGPSETYWCDYEVSLFIAKVKITTPDIRAYFAVSMLFDYVIYEGYSALLHEVHFQKAGTGIISWKLYQQK